MYPHCWTTARTGRSCRSESSMSSGLPGGSAAGGAARTSVGSHRTANHRGHAPRNAIFMLHCNMLGGNAAEMQRRREIPAVRCRIRLLSGRASGRTGESCRSPRALPSRKSRPPFSRRPHARRRSLPRSVSAAGSPFGQRPRPGVSIRWKVSGVTPSAAQSNASSTWTPLGSRQKTWTSRPPAARRLA